MDERLATWAAARGGVFTSAHAGELDVDESALRRMRHRDEVVRVRRDAYVLGTAWAAAGPEERLALRTRAVLSTRGEDVASHQAALALHRLPLHAVPLDIVDVLTEVDRVRTASGLRRNPRPTVLDVVTADGYRCVPVARAVVATALRYGLVAGLVPLDAALHRRLVAADALAAEVEALARTDRDRHRGAELVSRGDPCAESPGETLIRSVLVDQGFSLRSQAELRDPHGLLVGRVDLLVEGRVVVEFDGAVKYSGADGREALVREKVREDGLRALGYEVVRVTWADLAHPEVIVARVRRALARSAARGMVVAVS
jgi:very-short-patch-repair endonuclease